MAGLAGHRAGHAHRGFGAGIGLLQRDLEIEAQVLAAHVGPAAATALPPGAEHLLEDVAEHRAEIEALAALGAARAAGPHTAFEGRRAVAVVGRALVGIFQDVVGVIDALEPLLGVLVIPIAVRMMLHGELAERLLEVVSACRPADSEQLVIVLRHTLYAAPTCRLKIGLPLAREACFLVLAPAQPEPVFLFLSVTSSNSASTTFSFLASFAAPPPGAAPAAAPAWASAC